MTEQERKQRIAELRAELKELQATPRSDWHKAFEAFLRFATHRYEGVTVRVEVEIGLDAPRTDYVILTGDEPQRFEEAVFKVFRKFNILEYKNPHDALNERVIYKIAGYANLLIGTAEHEEDVPADQVTISIFRAVRNPELFKRRGEAGKLASTGTPGIYRVRGITEMPFQTVVTGELQGEEHAACRALTGRADELGVERVIEEGVRETDDAVREYYKIFLNLIAEKNPEVFAEIRRANDMEYAALMEVVKEDVDEKVRQTTATHIKDIMTNLKLTVEQAMDALSVPQSQRGTYADLVGKQTQ